MYLNLRVPEMNSIEDGQVSFAKSSSSVLKKSNLSKQNSSMGLGSKKSYLESINS